jgi:hypothetical protein
VNASGSAPENEQGQGSAEASDGVKIRKAYDPKRSFFDDVSALVSALLSILLSHSGLIPKDFL